MAVAVGDAWGSGVTVGVGEGFFFAASGFDAGVWPDVGDDADGRFPGVAAPEDAPTTCTMTAAAGDVEEIEDAEAQPVSINIELTDARYRRSCRMVVAIPF